MEVTALEEESLLEDSLLFLFEYFPSDSLSEATSSDEEAEVGKDVETDVETDDPVVEGDGSWIPFLFLPETGGNFGSSLGAADDSRDNAFGVSSVSVSLTTSSFPRLEYLIFLAEVSTDVSGDSHLVLLLEVLSLSLDSISVLLFLTSRRFLLLPPVLVFHSSSEESAGSLSLETVSVVSSE